MSVIVKPNTFSSGDIILASEHNSNFDTIYNEFNGEISNANIKSDAAIDLSKINIGATLSAWVNFNGTGTVATRSAYNVDSIIDSGTGIYTIVWGTAFADSSYCVTGMAGIGSQTGINIATQTSAYVIVNTTDSPSGALEDKAIICVSAIGNQ